MSFKYVSLPLFEDDFYNYAVSLEGESYNVELVYNERMALYIFNLYTADNTPIVLGQAFVPNAPMLLDYAIDGLSGYFWLESKSANDQEAYKSYPDKIHQYYNFYYLYVVED